MAEFLQSDIVVGCAVVRADAVIGISREWITGNQACVCIGQALAVATTEDGEDAEANG